MVFSIYKLQCVISLFVSIGILGINTILYEWASCDAMKYSIQMACTYFAVDIILGFKKYIKSDLSMLIHHVIFLIGGGFVYYSINNNMYDDDMHRVIKWVVSMEISTPFNGIRLFLNNTKYAYIGNILFGVVFIGVRTVATVFTHYELIDNKHYLFISPIVIVITMLNTMWISMIIRKSKNLPVIDYNIPQWNRITRLTVFFIPMTAICLMNNDYYYESYLMWMCSIVSILNHYGEIWIRTLDRLLCVMIYVAYFNVSIKLDQMYFVLLMELISAFIYYLAFNEKYASIHGITHILMYIGTICTLEL
jgi:hypothetical protein